MAYSPSWCKGNILCTQLGIYSCPHILLQLWVALVYSVQFLQPKQWKGEMHSHVNHDLCKCLWVSLVLIIRRIRKMHGGCHIPLTNNSVLHFTTFCGYHIMISALQIITSYITLSTLSQYISNRHIISIFHKWVPIHSWSWSVFILSRSFSSTLTWINDFRIAMATRNK